MLIGMLLECMGIGMVMPILSFLLDETLLENNQELSAIIDSMGNPSQEFLIVSMFGMLLLAFVLKNIYMLFLLWRQSSFCYSVIGNLSSRLLARYLHQPYSFHLSENSGNLIRNSTTEVGMYGFNFLIPVLNLLTEGLVLIGLTIILLFVEPVGTAILGITLVILWYFLQKPIKKLLILHGNLRQKYDGMRVTHIQESLGSVKDLKVLGREEAFLNEFYPLNQKWANSGRIQNVFQRIPPLLTEVVAIASMCVIVLFMFYNGKDTKALIPILGLFGAVAYRLLPSANRILSCMQAMNFGIPVIDVLSRELDFEGTEDDAESDDPSDRMIFEKEISVRGISFAYGNGAKSALNDVNMSIGFGESIGLIGPSGSGKSTMVDTILGLFKPQKGNVLVDEVCISTNLRSWRNQIGYVQQTIFLIDKSIRKNIAFGIPDEEIDELALKSALKSSQLEDFIAELPKGLATEVGERGIRLSGGQRQRIGIARALYHNPPILILDEATSALDTNTEREVMNDVNELKGDKTLIIVAHRLSTLENCDKLYRFEKGKVVQEGPPQCMIPSASRS